MRLSVEETEHLEFMERTVAPHSADVRSLCATVRRLAASGPVVGEGAILRAARKLSDINARECNINAEDNWKTYSEIYIRDSREILTAALEYKDHE